MLVSALPGRNFVICQNLYAGYPGEVTIMRHKSSSTDIQGRGQLNRVWLFRMDFHAS